MGKRFDSLGGLTIKEKRFVELYVNGPVKVAGNASECYRRVYAGEKSMKTETVWVKSCELLAKPTVKEAVRRLLDVEVNPETIKSMIKAETRGEHARDRLKAAELLGKTQAMFAEKNLVTVEVQQLAVDDELETLEKEAENTKTPTP